MSTRRSQLVNDLNTFGDYTLHTMYVILIENLLPQYYVKKTSFFLFKKNQFKILTNRKLNFVVFCKTVFLNKKLFRVKEASKTVFLMYSFRRRKMVLIIFLCFFICLVHMYPIVRVVSSVCRRDGIIIRLTQLEFQCKKINLKKSI